MLSFASHAAAAVEAALGPHSCSASFRPARLPGFDLQSDAPMRTHPGDVSASRAAAARASDALSGLPGVARAVASGPGFVNVAFDAAWLSSEAAAMASAPRLGVRDEGHGRSLAIDFGGPNVAKPLHVGHLRSFVIGESLRRVLVETGWVVTSDIHLGDWGLPIGKMLLGLMDVAPDACWREGRDPTMAEMQDAYVSGNLADRIGEARRLTAALQSGDPDVKATWARARAVSVESVRVTAAALGAHFDLFLGESDAAPHVPGLLSDLERSGHLYASDGALVVPGPEGSPPVMLAKSDGALTYAATDLATLRQRVAAGASRLVYCADVRQSLHFAGVFHVARVAGLAEGVQMDFAGFGTVNGPDGKPYKTRDGGVALLETLLEAARARARSRMGGADADGISPKLALAAVKFADLSSPRETGYVFDLDRMTAPEGRTGPYLLYAAARIRSIVAKSGRGPSVGAYPSCEHEAERALALECLSYPDAVSKAAERLEPREVADKLYAVARAFSRFYAACPVVTPDGPDLGRLALCSLAGSVLASGLRLLGIEEPERM